MCEWPHGTASGIQGVMYFNSKPKDAVACQMHVKDGRIAFDPIVSNPGISWVKFILKKTKKRMR